MVDKMEKTREEFITENQHLFWYIKKDKLHQISDEVLVEFVMNYGNLEAVKTLFKVVGKAKLASIFYKLEGRRKLNYFPEIYNFYKLLISNHAPGNS